MLKKNIVQLSLLCAVSFFSVTSFAAWQWANKPLHPFYVGATGGYGETTWGQLVSDNSDDSPALDMSAPINASEGGLVWGVYGGYEFIRAFALEASYMRYPTASIQFSPLSFFSFFHDGRTSFSSKTESVSLVAKVMVPIPCSSFRLYSTFGAAGVHRDDVAANVWRLSPQFGAGLNYDITDRTMLELGTEYVAGYGQSELEPATHYIPFLYSGFLRIAYRI
jgi:opacity protein-like surface antigen